MIILKFTASTSVAALAPAVHLVISAALTKDAALANNAPLVMDAASENGVLLVTVAVLVPVAILVKNVRLVWVVSFMKDAASMEGVTSVRGVPSCMNVCLTCVVALANGANLVKVAALKAGALKMVNISRVIGLAASAEKHTFSVMATATCLFARDAGFRRSMSLSSV